MAKPLTQLYIDTNTGMATVCCKVKQVVDVCKLFVVYCFDEPNKICRNIKAETKTKQAGVFELWRKSFHLADSTTNAKLFESKMGQKVTRYMYTDVEVVSAFTMLHDISAITADPATLDMFCKAGGMEAMVELLKRYRDGPPKLLEKTFLVLRNLIVNVDNQVNFGKAGGIEAIVKVMQHGKRHVEMQGSACLVLHDITANPDNRIRFGKAGGVETMVQLLTRHCHGQPQLLNNAFFALRNILANAENHSKFRKAGGISLAKLGEAASMVGSTLNFENHIACGKVAVHVFKLACPCCGFLKAALKAVRRKYSCLKELLNSLT